MSFALRTASGTRVRLIDSFGGGGTGRAIGIASAAESADRAGRAIIGESGTRARGEAELMEARRIIGLLGGDAITAGGDADEGEESGGIARGVLKIGCVHGNP